LLGILVAITCYSNSKIVLDPISKYYSSFHYYAAVLACIQYILKLDCEVILLIFFGKEISAWIFWKNGKLVIWESSAKKLNSILIYIVFFRFLRVPQFPSFVSFYFANVPVFFIFVTHQYRFIHQITII